MIILANYITKDLSVLETGFEQIPTYQFHLALLSFYPGTQENDGHFLLSSYFVFNSMQND